MGNTLEEKIKEAVENNQLDEMMSILRMEAVKQQISEEELNLMIEKEQEAFRQENETRESQENNRQSEESHAKEEEIRNKAVEAAKRNKHILWAIAAVLVILEWLLIFRAHPAEGESHRLILTLIVNFITLVAFVIGAAIYFRKHN